MLAANSAMSYQQARMQSQLLEEMTYSNNLKLLEYLRQKAEETGKPILCRRSGTTTMDCKVNLVNVTHQLTREQVLSMSGVGLLMLEEDHLLADKKAFLQDFKDYIEKSWKAHKSMDNKTYVVTYNEDGSTEVDLLRLMTPARLQSKDYRITDENDPEVKAGLENINGVMKTLTKSKTASRIFRTAQLVQKALK